MSEPTCTADAVVFARHNQELHVLLIRRRWNPFEGHWALPGGHVDDGEHPAAAASRELLEETGLHVPRGTLRNVGRYDAPHRDPRGYYVSDAYTVELTHRADVVGSDDATEARWWPLALLDDVEVAFDHRQIIHDAR